MTSSATTGSRTALVITVALYATSTMPKPILDATAPQVLDDVVAKTRPWFQHASGGAFSGYFGIARGPVNVRTTQPTCSTPWLREIGDQADAAVKAHEPALNLDDYSAVVYYFGHVAACDKVAAGWGHTPEQGKRVWLNGDRTVRTVVHEFGHNLGLNHSGSQQCLNAVGAWVPLSNNCSTAEYGDLFSAMGGTTSAADGYAPVQQKYLGWNQDRTTTVFAGDPVKTVLLTPVEDNPLPGTTRAVRLRDGATELWLEYHGIDRPEYVGLDWYTTGLLVRREMNPLAVSPALLFMNREDNTPLGTNYHPNMFVGQTWTNPLGGMSITLNSADASGAVVTITSPPPAPSPVRTVPKITGLDIDAAARAIRAADLTVGVVTSKVDCDRLFTVVKQSPTAGTQVLPGFAVDYTYGVQPQNGCGTPH